jgi:uncharacterized protein YkwD
MGRADRDYMRAGPGRNRRLLANLFGIALLLVLGAGALTLLRTPHGQDSTVVVSPGIPALGLTVQSQSLYPTDDPWRAYLAPESVCPGGETRSASLEAQEQTMRCLLNWARERRGLRPLREQPLLALSANLKARDIYRCGEFAHEACGKHADAVVAEVGLRPAGWGENLYSGPRDFGRPRVAVDQWLNSPGHRDNLFRSEWTEQGVALLPARSFGGQPDVAIWVSHFSRS